MISIAKVITVTNIVIIIVIVINIVIISVVIIGVIDWKWWVSVFCCSVLI